jgi:hypothetical protein
MLVVMRVLPVIAGLLVVASLCPGAGARRQPVRAVPEVIGQRYCPEDGEVFGVLFQLRITYTNQTRHTLILDKEIGKSWYQIGAARNLEDLKAAKYEYAPNIDWEITDEAHLPKTASPAEPGTDFVILAPGESYQSEINILVFAQYESPKKVSGTLSAGSHVLRIDLDSFVHLGAPARLEKSWKRGRIVTGRVVTEPVTIQVPANPKVEAAC